MLCLHPAALNWRATPVPSPHPCRMRPPAQRVRASTTFTHMQAFRFSTVATARIQGDPITKVTKCLIMTGQQDHCISQATRTCLASFSVAACRARRSCRSAPRSGQRGRRCRTDLRACRAANRRCGSGVVSDLSDGCSSGGRAQRHASTARAAARSPCSKASA